MVAARRSRCAARWRRSRRCRRRSVGDGSPALPPGTLLGPYNGDALLDAGGMGEVYRARDNRLHRDVAIKVLPAHRLGDVDARARFEREARAIASLSHPNICGVRRRPRGWSRSRSRRAGLPGAPGAPAKHAGGGAFRGQKGARSHGNAGIPGSPGNVVSVTYRIYTTPERPNPSLSAKSIPCFQIVTGALTCQGVMNPFISSLGRSSFINDRQRNGSYTPKTGPGGRRSWMGAAETRGRDVRARKRPGRFVLTDVNR